MNLTEEQIALIKKAKSVAEFSKLAKKSGFNISNKEIEEIYNLYHYPNKKMAEAELTNVVGGVRICGDSAYSDDICLDGGDIKRKYLIVTAGHSCSFTSEKGDYWMCSCFHCKFSRKVGLMMYCTLRWWEGDSHGHESNPDSRRYG